MQFMTSGLDFFGSDAKAETRQRKMVAGRRHTRSKYNCRLASTKSFVYSISFGRAVNANRSDRRTTETPKYYLLVVCVLEFKSHNQNARLLHSPILTRIRKKNQQNFVSVSLVDRACVHTSHAQLRSHTHASRTHTQQSVFRFCRLLYSLYSLSAGTGIGVAVSISRSLKRECTKCVCCIFIRTRCTDDVSRSMRR